MKVLVVDDNAAVRRLIAAVLAPMEPEIVECADGVSAIAAYEAHRPDVVLMDIAMTGLDGIAATAGIIAMHPAARVVVVTNHDGPDLRAAASRAGGRGYVLKDDLVDLPAMLISLGCA
jgi:DNA-binding NarL/FixJ family response regulator